MRRQTAARGSNRARCAVAYTSLPPPPPPPPPPCVPPLTPSSAHTSPRVRPRRRAAQLATHRRLNCVELLRPPGAFDATKRATPRWEPTFASDLRTYHSSQRCPPGCLYPNHARRARPAPPVAPATRPQCPRPRRAAPMSSPAPPEHLRFDSAFSDDDDFSNLTVVDVTPRNSLVLASSARSHSTALSASTSSHYTSRPSLDLPSFRNALSPAARPTHAPHSAADKPEPPIEEPFSFAGLFAGFKKALKNNSPKSSSIKCTTPSPSSVVQQSNAHHPSTSRANASTLSPSRAPQKTAPAELSRPIFRAIDGADAREFRLFLDDDDPTTTNPVITLVPYGRDGGYALDIFLIIHNTVRCELVDTFQIISVIRADFLSLSLRDVHNFRQWWRFFFLLWTEYITYYKNLLEPIIQNICHVDGRSDILRKRLRPLRAAKEWLCLKMEEITSYVEEFESLPPARALCLICKNVHSFAQNLNTYFRGCENLLPSFIESYHGEQVKLTTECQLIEQLRKNDHFPELMASIIRWIGTTNASSDAALESKLQTKERDKWLASHMFWLERPKVWYFYQRYEATHRSIFKRFVTRVRTLDSM
ncbi:trefoil factor [Gracilaria domingensis]|nr:trefoil factor [Gracilaria domingensis]